MAESNDLIDFNVIEAQKENIQALPSGRSAKALAQLYSPPLFQAQPSPALSEPLIKARSAFEKELANIDEADDPLDVYDRYVKWTLDAFPSAQATPQSQLLPLLERATKTFQGSSHYKNDPRYLKLWLHYIRLFSDAPRETFVFLARHGIGESLALYYEEYAAWLENAGRWNQAEEIYKMGIENEARPAERLMRKFGEFERRKAAQPESVTEPSSPALPAVRPALAAKMDPFATASPDTVQQARSSTTKKSKGSKMAIFSDDDAPTRPDSNSSSKGWDSIGSLADRRKENSIEAKPWAGEKLVVGKTNGGVQKMMVFKDKSARNSIPLPQHLFLRTSGHNHKQQCTVNATSGRTECIYVNLEALYPQRRPKVEYCFEELIARRRGLVGVDWSKRPAATRVSESDVAATEKPFAIFEDLPATESNAKSELGELSIEPLQVFVDTSIETVTTSKKPRERGFEIFEDSALPSLDSRKLSVHGDIEDVLVKSFSKTLALNDENDENAPPAQSSEDLAKKARKEEKANRTRKIKIPSVKHIKNETKTIQLNMESPSGPKIKRKKSGDRPEPTMTINTREAMDEIYGIFNQPLQSAQPDDVNEDVEEEDDDSSSESDDDYTTGDESTATGKLSAPASEYGDETRNDILAHQKTLEAEDTGISDWSDFTRSKHVLDAESSEDIVEDERLGQDEDAITTPVDEEEQHTRYVPMPPEDYEPPMHYHRDMSMIPNHRLPFMTPIVERTESSLGGMTVKTEKSYLGTKTPSRQGVMNDILDDDDESQDIPSSPFQDITADIDEDRRRVLQPIRTKTTQGTISLGQGSVKNQIESKNVAKTVETAKTGPIILDKQCNPMDPALRDIILAEMQPPLHEIEGYHEDLTLTLNRTAEIRKFIKSQSKTKSSSNNTETILTLTLPNSQATYTVKRELGAGTFAPVYLITTTPHTTPLPFPRQPLEALKMEQPTSTWEFYMLSRLHSALATTRPANSIIRAHEMHRHADECFLIEDYRDQGTLLDLVNLARSESALFSSGLAGAGAGGSGVAGAGLDEMLAMWLTVELLRTVEGMHARGLIHGDLKGDNVLVRFDEVGDEEDWSPRFFASGAHGWGAKGVCLIDLGRGIDMRFFEDGVGFVADWKCGEGDCVEMREARVWTYQIDYWGLAGVVHSLLFGKYMETIGEVKGDAIGGLGEAGRKTWRIRESLKRYWQTEIWAEVFHLLLNPMMHVGGEEGGKMPVVREMRACRERMEAWLEENCERGMGLKGMIVKLEMAIKEKKKRSGRM